MGVEPINNGFADQSPADEGQDLYNVELTRIERATYCLQGNRSTN